VTERPDTDVINQSIFKNNVLNVASVTLSRSAGAIASQCDLPFTKIVCKTKLIRLTRVQRRHFEMANGQCMLNTSQFWSRTCQTLFFVSLSALMMT